MKIQRFLFVAILFVASLVLAGCMNMQQELWFNPDGSGKFSMDVGMSESLVNMAEVSGGTGIPTEQDLKQQFVGSNADYVKNVETKTYTKDGYVHYTVSADVSDMQKFFASSQFKNEGFAVTLEKLANGNSSFKQAINMNSALGSSSGLGESSTDMASMMGAAFEGQYWTLRVHVPNMVNTNGAWNKSGGYAEWKVPMKDLFSNQGYEMSLEYSSRPSLLGILLKVALFGLIALVVLAIAAVVIFFILKRRNTPPAPSEPAAQA
jgi:hypothetical protein